MNYERNNTSRAKEDVELFAKSRSDDCRHLPKKIKDLQDSNVSSLSKFIHCSQRLLKGQIWGCMQWTKVGSHRLFSCIVRPLHMVV